MITERTTRYTRGIINNYANFGDNDVGCMHRGALSFSCNSLSSAPLARSLCLFSLSLSFVLLSYLLATLPASIALSPLPPPPLSEERRRLNELKVIFAASSTLPTGSERKTLRVSKGEDGSLSLPPLVSKVLPLDRFHIAYFS